MAVDLAGVPSIQEVLIATNGLSRRNDLAKKRLEYLKNRDSEVRRSVDYIRIHADARRLVEAKYRSSHVVELVAKRKQRYLRNRVVVCAARREWYRRNKDSESVRKKKYYAKNKDLFKERNAKYYLKNRNRLVLLRRLTNRKRKR